MITPAFFCSSVNRERALYAPRNLKAPIRWKFSHLRYTLAPTIPLRVLDVRTGVLLAMPLSRLLAETTSLYLGSFNCTFYIQGELVF